MLYEVITNVMFGGLPQLYFYQRFQISDTSILNSASEDLRVLKVSGASFRSAGAICFARITACGHDIRNNFV